MQSFRKNHYRFPRYLKTARRTNGQTNEQGRLLRTPSGKPGVQNNHRWLLKIPLVLAKYNIGKNTIYFFFIYFIFYTNPLPNLSNYFVYKADSWPASNYLKQQIPTWWRKWQPFQFFIKIQITISKGVIWNLENNMEMCL